MKTAATVKWPPGQQTSGELRRRRADLERMTPQMREDDGRLPGLRGELNLIIAEQEQRAGTPVCLVRDKQEWLPVTRLA